VAGGGLGSELRVADGERGLLLVVGVHSEQHRQPAVGGDAQPTSRRHGSDHRQVTARSRHQFQVVGHLPGVQRVADPPGAQRGEQRVQCRWVAALPPLEPDAEDIQLHPRTAAADPEHEPAPGEPIQ